MYCPQCKAENLKFASGCFQCGKNLSTIKNESGLKCSYCGADIAYDAFFCWSCGESNIKRIDNKQNNLPENKIQENIKFSKTCDVVLEQSTVRVFNSPGINSEVKMTFNKGEKFSLGKVIAHDGIKWVEIQSISGEIGYITGETKIKKIAGSETIKQQNIDSNAKNKRRMISGALWCIGGIIVTAVTYSNASSSPTGGHYVIAWGAIIFGFIDFIRGFIGWSENPESDDNNRIVNTESSKSVGNKYDDIKIESVKEKRSFADGDI